MKKVAIVLSGGGARGAYEIGVWEALRRLHIKYDIVTGTSIGAINGLMMVQGTYRKALEFWHRVDYVDIFDKDYSEYTGPKLYSKYLKDVISNGGFSTEKMENLVRLVYNEKKFKNSKVNYGLATLNITDLKPTIIKKEDVDSSNIVDYVIASGSVFPFFKRKEIDNKKYVDGCYFENMPINLAIELGATDIIAVNIGTFARNQKVKDKSVNIKYIVPRNEILSFLEFNKKDIRLAISYGYNDTMKEFGKLEGNEYTFTKGSLKYNYNKYIDKFMDLIIKCEDQKLFSIRKNQKLTKEEFSELLEYIGKIFEIDSSKIYCIKTFNKLILERYKQVIPNVTLNSSKNLIKFIALKLKNKENVVNLFYKDYESALYIMMLQGDEL